MDDLNESEDWSKAVRAVSWDAPGSHVDTSATKSEAGNSQAYTEAHGRQSPLISVGYFAITSPTFIASAPLQEM